MTVSQQNGTERSTSDRGLSVDPSSLPPGDLPSLELVNLEDEEKESVWLLNSSEWQGALTLEAYIRREHHLAAQPLTLNGGLTYWALVDGTSKKTPRLLLSTVESLRKKAIIARRGGAVEETISHGIGSVFCRPEHRRKGYAARMIQELGRKLETWQQPKGESAKFTVLYSDIGKKFYAKLGWKPFCSSHISLPPVAGVETTKALPQASPLFANDLPSLCAADEAILRKTIVDFPENGPDTRIALLPDAETMAWHHSREEFVANEILHRIPDVKGAIVRGEDGMNVWCIWTRTFGGEEDGNTLHILRMVVEGDEAFGAEIQNDASAKGSANQSQIAAAAACLRAAQAEAANWTMQEVEIWNPSATVSAAAKHLLPSLKLVHRESTSIASLKWYGSGIGIGEEVEWIGNEKYGWC